LIPYIHFTLYHYIYAADMYDILVVPLIESLRDYVVLKSHKWPSRIRMLF
jgi:hypothetical protein